MNQTPHYQKLENMYHASACNEYYHSRLSISDQGAQVTIPVKPAFFHAAGAVHGSVYFKALDDAAYFAVSAVVDDVVVLTTVFNLYLLRPVSTGVLTAEGFVISRSRQLFVAESVLYDERSRKIATGSGQFVKSRVGLTEEIGYR